MAKYLLNIRYFLFFIGMTLIILTDTGCQSLGKNSAKPDNLPIETGRIVILGFIPGMPQSGETGIIQSPISGAAFMAEPVDQSVADNLTDRLFSRMLGFKRYDLISSDQAKGVLFNAISSNQGMRDLEIFQKTGQAFSADAVMAGYIYRWQEREGTNYSAKRPSSVAFELYLIRSSDKAILWKGRFDKTQKALSENIFDMGLFLKSKGKWMTADELAELGIEELLGVSSLEEHKSDH